MILTMLRAGGPMITGEELLAGAIRLGAAVAVGMLAYQLVRRVPWPRPFRWRFGALHLVAAPLAALAWIALATPLELLLASSGTDLRGAARVRELMVVGVFFYFVIVAVSYAAEGSARAARAEASAARTQLAALRAQVQPHFLFNALHTVVQLIPLDPKRAAEAAEQVGELLRVTLEEQRDEVTVAEEWRFVSRYLALEQLRFGDRLRVRADLPDAIGGERVPSFALQTLVENSVHHGAAPRVAPTEIVVTGSTTSTRMTLAVRNTGDGARPRANGGRVGTGLARLRERLTVLYGSEAQLVSRPTDDGGFEATLTIPRRSE